MSEVQISDTNQYISAFIAGLKHGEEIELVENGKQVAVLRKEPEVTSRVRQDRPLARYSTWQTTLTYAG